MNRRERLFPANRKMDLAPVEKPGQPEAVDFFPGSRLYRGPIRFWRVLPVEKEKAWEASKIWSSSKNRGVKKAG